MSSSYTHHIHTHNSHHTCTPYMVTLTMHMYQYHTDMHTYTHPTFTPPHTLSLGLRLEENLAAIEAQEQGTDTVLDAKGTTAWLALEGARDAQGWGARRRCEQGTVVGGKLVQGRGWGEGGCMCDGCASNFVCWFVCWFVRHFIRRSHFCMSVRMCLYMLWSCIMTSPPLSP